MKRIRKTVTASNAEHYDKLAQIYSCLLTAQSLIGEAEDYYFGDEKIVPALTRCYDRVEGARKAISKYCEQFYE